MSRERWFTVVPRYPIVGDFITTNSMGTPLVLNSLTGLLYYLMGNVVTAVAGGTGGMPQTIEINVADYLTTPRTPDVTDDLAAFNAALAALKALSISTSGSFRATPKLIIPHGKYYLSDTLNVHQTVYIQGTGSGQPNAIGPLLRFAPNKNGVVFNDYRTNNDAGSAGDNGLGDASGSILEGIALWGGGAVSSTGPYVNAANSTGHGIRIRCISVKIVDVFIAFFGEDGINIDATAGSAGRTQGNANTFHLERIWATYNGRYGMLCNGLDVNAGNTLTFSAVSNGGGGIMDYSFLGNTYTACHVRDCGIYSPNTANVKPVSVCLYGGLRYYVVAGQEVAASTTTPGTNTAVWRQYAGYGGPTWVSGMTWVTGAPYGTNPSNVNARNVFIGCYAESGQSPVQATHPTLFVGGLLDEVTVVGTASWVKAGPNGLENAIGFSLNGTNAVQLYGQDGGNEVAYYQRGTDNFRTGFTPTFGNSIRTQHQNSFVSSSMGLASYAGGNYEPYHYWFGKLYVGTPDAGNPTAGLRIGCANNAVADFAGVTVKTGGVYFNQNPALGGASHFVVTAGGVGGAGATIIPSGIVGGIQMTNTANIAAAPTQADFNNLLAKFQTAKLMA